MRNYKEIQEAISIEADLMTLRLQKFTYDLIKLVESDQIESFSFKEDKENLLRVSITVKSDPAIVVLGLFKDLKSLPKADTLFSDKTFVKLNEINGYLDFANEYFKSQLPSIAETTYYSINAVNKLGSFKEAPVKTLLPKFMKTELTPMKLAIKPK